MPQPRTATARTAPRSRAPEFATAGGVVLPGAAGAAGTAIGLDATAAVARAGLKGSKDGVIAAIVAALLLSIEAIQKRLAANLEQTLSARFPGEDPSSVIAAEQGFAEEFRRRSEQRVRAGLRTALDLPTREDEVKRLDAAIATEERKQTPDAAQLSALRRERDRFEYMSGPRERAVRGILVQEQRFASQHVQASFARTVAGGERVVLRRDSPLGAFWDLDPFVREHTAGCLIMGGRFWPWVVLDRVHPPRHAACPCRLRGYGDALQAGLMRPGDIPTEEDAIGMAAGVLMEGEAEGLLALLELERRNHPGVGALLGRG